MINTYTFKIFLLIAYVYMSCFSMQEDNQQSQELLFGTYIDLRFNFETPKSFNFELAQKEFLLICERMFPKINKLMSENSNLLHIFEHNEPSLIITFRANLKEKKINWDYATDIANMTKNPIVNIVQYECFKLYVQACMLLMRLRLKKVIKDYHINLESNEWIEISLRIFYDSTT